MTERKSYRGVRRLDNFVDRFEYLALHGGVGVATFGFERWINQAFYTSKEWRDLRPYIISRDEGCDLGVKGYDLHEKIIIHHIIPMTVEDLESGNPLILDPDNLICVSHNTHNAIHYGDRSLLRLPPVERQPGDTKLW